MRQRSDMNHSALVLVPEIRFAHAAAIRLLDPSNTSVPIVTVFGPSGVGKTQLATHIAKTAVAHDPDLSISHLTAAELSLELAKASSAGMIDEFQASYRHQDLFICEDIQALERRKESQSQLLAICDAVIAEGGRILLTSNRPPGEINGLCAKLVNRCHGGVCGEIEMPGPGTRAVLLQEFAQGRGLILKDHWVQKLAKRIDGTPRELLGAITQLESIAANRQIPIDDGIVSEYLSQIHETSGPTLSRIAKQVCAEFNVPLGELRDGGRGQAIVLPRQVAMYIAREGGRHRYKEIGRYFGNRSHSTVVHACQQVAERMKEETQLWQQVQQICSTLKLPALPSSRQLVEET